ncbi:MAG: folylpolyglutamate synthase/dihydrofolate synthase family protein [Chloroflexota bacterium]|nr:folylpolyglutamate synthase/dihydrofolate synthase family protein [Chloroflexota bacterium]
MPNSLTPNLPTCISQEKEYNPHPTRTMNYPEAIAYLHSLIDYEKMRLERYTPETHNLSRVERLLAAMGNPHNRFSAVHIAGTKGKGSSAAMCEACLRAAGYRTGFYISPHLHTFRERIQVAGRKIAQEDVVALVEEARPLIERVPDVTYFEAITAIGFLYFARSEVEVAVVEVGLGGRLDATNVLTPDVSVITSLSLEHMYLLGNTLAEIAYEKAGIIKPGVPVVSAPQRAEAIQVLESVSREREAPLTEVGRDWDYEPGPADLAGQSFTTRRITGGDSGLNGEYWIPLLGRHQLENAASTVAALDILRQRGFRIPTEAVHEGLRCVYWPGRMEILSREPLVVIDGAHNPYSVQVLCRALEEWFPGQRWVLILGASVDKDVAEMLRVLLPLSEYVIVTRSDHPRAAAPVKLADVVASVGGGAEVSVNVRKSLRRGLRMMYPDSGLLVTGSIHLVADVREEWARRVGAPLPDNDGEEEV